MSVAAPPVHFTFVGSGIGSVDEMVGGEQREERVVAAVRIAQGVDVIAVVDFDDAGWLPKSRETPDEVWSSVAVPASAPPDEHPMASAAARPAATNA